jgi:hypothetical protein
MSALMPTFSGSFALLKFLNAPGYMRMSCRFKATTKIPFLADKALRLAPLRALSPVGLFVTIMSSSSDEALRKPLTAPTGVEVRDGAP